VRTRRYHGLLVTATTPPNGRQVLVSGFDVAVETPGGSWWLSTQRYDGDVTGGDGERHLQSFTGGGEGEPNPWPTWIYRLPDGTRIQQEVLMRAGAPQVFVSWRLLSATRAPTAAPDLAWARLRVRPFFAGRDFHALMHENSRFSFDPEIRGDSFRFRPYATGPTVVVSSSGSYRHQPHWYRGFAYDEERARGLDFVEDLAAPGEWEFELGAGDAAMVFGCERTRRDPDIVPAREAVAQARASERARRARLGGPLERAADQYVVERGAGKTIIAGYPWFGDWGRDTFIALRGLCLATGRTTDALQILTAWAELVSDGMLPNFFPDDTGAPEYNTVDASLWYAIAVGETLQAAGAAVDGLDRRRLINAVEAILTGYARGTRYGIHATEDGLLAAGQVGQQLTWMDARVDGREATPRIGKPVEIQALWLNALAAAVGMGCPSEARWQDLLRRGQASFEARFWDETRGCLYDVVDVDHHAGAVDPTLRPNQILAVGGLPLPLLSGQRARQVVDAVEAALVTPLGLRSLAPHEPGYCARYQGGVAARDGAYHQGTVWPWLLGPFVEAYVRVHGDTADARRQARSRFVAPLLAHLSEAGLGHVSEVADAEAPHRPGGCPFQAWSLGELLRLERVVLAPKMEPCSPANSRGKTAASVGNDRRRLVAETKSVG
ncbi:MAG TPA: amylo-alpha-1,6-glucosidase, partial [Polyangia bacterium]|nr:amylo-alpha-1,6-glucosidase [Polyangia bacterium]